MGLILPQTSGKGLTGGECEEQEGAGALGACLGPPLTPPQPLSQRVVQPRRWGRRLLAAGTAQMKAPGRAEIGLDEVAQMKWA